MRKSSFTAALALAIASVLLSPVAARAEFGFAPGSPTVRVLDAAGEPYALAGGHPDRVQLEIEFNSQEGKVEGNAKELVFDFPPGFAGDASAVPACHRRALADGRSDPCGPETQVGILTLRIRVVSGEVLELQQPLFNVEPAPDELAVIGFQAFGRTLLTMEMRHDDFGLTIEQGDISQTLPALGMRVELWGIPADHQTGTDIPRRPFVTLPARCDRGAFGITVRARSWQEPGRTVAAAADTGVPLAGCGALPFGPSLSFDLANPAADSATGATIDLTMPSDSGPAARASVPLEGAEIELPEELSLSPGVVADLSTCPERDLHAGSALPAACPAASQVGAVQLDGPQLRRPIDGDLYVGEQRPGERFRLFAVAEGMGLAAKMTAALRPDPGGRLTAVLSGLPEVPLSRIRMRFDDGPDALLATPLACGSAIATGTFRGHGDPRVVRSTDAAAIDRGAAGGPCPDRPPFSPRFGGGVDDPRAGRHTALSLTLLRSAGEEPAERFEVTLPAGLSAAIGRLEPCSGQAAASGSCPAASRVGSAIAQIGSGTSLTSLRGDAYLTDRHGRAPFGLALVLPAAIGPFDLGTTVVRAALRVDPHSGRLSVQTDPLPRFVEGIPLRLRVLGLDIDRPGFVRNPTSCEPATLEASVRSTRGDLRTRSTPFEIEGCDKLRFAPSLSMRLTGRSPTRPGARPGLRLAIRPGPRGANLRVIDVALPEWLRLKASGLRAICSRRDALDGKCDSASRVGRVSGRTPIFDDALSGPIHVVQPTGDGLPELWVSLGAEGIHFDAPAQMVVRGGRVRLRLAGLPDVPLARLALRLDGGPRGLIALAGDPCSREEKGGPARVAFEGQNDAYLIGRERIGVPRCRSAGNSTAALRKRGKGRG